MNGTDFSEIETVTDGVARLAMADMRAIDLHERDAAEVTDSLASCDEVRCERCGRLASDNVCDPCWAIEQQAACDAAAEPRGRDMFDEIAAICDEAGQ